MLEAYNRGKVLIFCPCCSYPWRRQLWKGCFLVGSLVLIIRIVSGRPDAKQKWRGIFYVITVQ